MASTSRLAGIDRFFRAFADGTRLRILCLLARNECCVGDLVETLGIEQPSVSRHLSYLRKAGLVSVRNSGLWKYYSLAQAKAKYHEKVIECLSCCFDEVPQIQTDRVRYAKVKKGGGCCPAE